MHEPAGMVTMGVPSLDGSSAREKRNMMTFAPERVGSGHSVENGKHFNLGDLVNIEKT